VSESNRLPALHTKPIFRLETDGVKWFWQSFGKVSGFGKLPMFPGLLSLQESSSILTVEGQQLFQS
jgi:hypothetical protein